MVTYETLTADLRLFDGEGAGEAGAPAETTAVPGSGRREKTGEKVVYGKGSPDAGGSNGDLAEPDGSVGRGGADEAERMPDESRAEQSEVRSEEDRETAFERLVSQEYKDLFDKRVQKIINRRFKEVKGLEGQMEATRPILDMIAQRYGIEDGDPAKLAQAMEADDAYWAEAAEQHGMTVPQFREYTKLQRENEAFRKEAQRRQGEQAARQQLEAWHREAAEVQGAYPGFDLAAECADPQFLSMLKAGVPMRHAYEVRHLDDIKTGVAAQVSKQTERQVTETIRAKGARPAENGASGASGILVKSDPSKLSKADRAEIARRVARGEQIAF